MSRHTYKALIMGNSETGKSSFLSHWKTGASSPEYNPTLGVHVVSETLPSLTDKLDLWELSAQAPYHFLGSAYMRASHLAVIFVRINKTTDNNYALEIMKKLKKESPATRLILVLNQSDAELLTITKKNIPEKLKEAFADCPIVTLNTCTGAGVSSLIETIKDLLLQCEKRASSNPELVSEPIAPPIIHTKKAIERTIENRSPWYCCWRPKRT